MYASKTGLGFTVQWIIATFGGFLLSLLLIEIGEKPDIGILHALIGGLAIALPQAAVIRHPTLSIWWIWSSILGWTVITATGVGAVGWTAIANDSIPMRVLYGTIMGGIAGFALGIFQWMAIRQEHPSAWQWIQISNITWAIAVPVGSIVGFVLHSLTQYFLGEVIGLTITWLIVATITGIYAYKFFR
jgi:hypothetical protein